MVKKDTKRNLCICRFLQKDLGTLAKEFGLNVIELETEVTKKERYKKFQVIKGVWLIKYFTHRGIRMYDNGYIIHVTRHNYYLQGDEEKVHDILSKTCGIKTRGCFIPLIEDKDFKF